MSSVLWVHYFVQFINQLWAVNLFCVEHKFLAPYSPNSTFCVTSRHDKHDVRASRDVMWRDVSCRACCAVLVPTWRTDQEAVVLACKTISCFVIIYHFSSQMKLIRLLKTNYGVITLYTLQTKLRIALVALAATCCVAFPVGPTACATQHVRLFPVPKCMG